MKKLVLAIAAIALVTMTSTVEAKKGRRGGRGMKHLFVQFDFVADEKIKMDEWFRGVLTLSVQKGETFNSGEKMEDFSNKTFSRFRALDKNKDEMLNLNEFRRAAFLLD